MQAEILDYRHTTEWDLESILKDESFNKNLQPKFPLITSSISNRELNSIENCWNDYTIGKRRGRPTDVLDAFPGGFSRRVGDYLGLTGESIIVNASCASAIYAFNLGAMYSQMLNSPVVIVCADNVNHPFDLWRFKSLGALDNDTGRPFDKSSKGFKMGTGISLFLIKHPSVKFSMSAIATITDFAFYTNNSLMTGPGEVDDIINNLSGINYKSIDFWNAHATGTPVGDIVEYNVFNKTITQDIPIVSYKGYIGHCICAAGAMELAMSLDGKKNNILLPNKIEGESIVVDDRIITTQTSFTYKRMLKASLGFGGKTAVAVIDLY
jgi:3-oxoacyl-[acyl-carrier-protein] synthase II